MKNKIKQIQTMGIIMDGNRRWARERGLSVVAGHRQGADKLREVLAWSRDAGIKTVIAYAFSTENWHRKKREVNFIFNLFRKFLKTEIETLIKDKISFRCLGDRSALPKDIQVAIEVSEAKTKDLGPTQLCLAISYGGRAEILQAVKTLAKLYPGQLDQIGEKEFSQSLFTAGLSDPDLILRTGGERRLSNFLPWQSIYSELAFTPTYWPALSRQEFTAILAEVGNRDRRFGA
mgnify:CR=1 FL=1